MIDGRMRAGGQMLLTEQVSVNNCGQFVNYVDPYQSSIRYDIPSSTASGDSLAELISNRIVIVERVGVSQEEYFEIKEMFSDVVGELDDIRNSIVHLHEKNKVFQDWVQRK